MNRAFAAATFALLAGAGPAHAVGHLADIVLYDRTEHRTLPVYEHGGKHYVVGNPGNEYQIQLRNQSARDILTVVSVDGVNVVSGETANWVQSGYVLDAWSSMDIKGWRKSLERTAAFYFTRLPDSYAARTGRPDNVGVIGVAIFERKADPVPYPEPIAQEDRMDEPSRNAQAPAAAGRAEAESGSLADHRRSKRSAEQQRLGTGHGRSETSYARYTSFERATEAPSEIVSIHYDSHDNLLAQGVIPQDEHIESMARTPFPGQFVPDPPRYYAR